jgi:hypothetical protein
MLAHYHYLNKGVLPFRLSLDGEGRKELARIAELTEEQIGFIRKTAIIVFAPEKRKSFSSSCVCGIIQSNCQCALQRKSLKISGRRELMDTIFTGYPSYTMNLGNQAQFLGNDPCLPELAMYWKSILHVCCFAWH